jgi:hypothetical protein
MMITVQMLKSMHTKTLLKVLNIFRRSSVPIRSQAELDLIWERDFSSSPELAGFAGFIRDRDELHKRTYLTPKMFGYEDYGCTCEVTIADLKNELATREHVPNKKEAKQLRKKKIKESVGKGRRDR